MVQGKDTKTGRLREIKEMEHAKTTEPHNGEAGGDSKTAANGKGAKVTKRLEVQRAPPGSLQLRPVKRRNLVILDDSEEEDWEDLPRADPLWLETVVHLLLREQATLEEVQSEPLLPSPRPSLQSFPTSQTPVRPSSPSPSSQRSTLPSLLAGDATATRAATQTPLMLEQSTPSAVKMAANVTLLVPQRAWRVAKEAQSDGCHLLACSGRAPRSTCQPSKEQCAI